MGSNSRVSNNHNDHGLCPVCGGEHVDRQFNQFVDPITGKCKKCGQVHRHGNDTVRISLEDGCFITTSTTADIDAINSDFYLGDRDPNTGTNTNTMGSPRSWQRFRGHDRK